MDFVVVAFLLLHCSVYAWCCVVCGVRVCLFFPFLVLIIITRTHLSTIRMYVCMHICMYIYICNVTYDCMIVCTYICTNREWLYERARTWLTQIIIDKCARAHTHILKDMCARPRWRFFFSFSFYIIVRARMYLLYLYR